MSRCRAAFSPLVVLSAGLVLACAGAGAGAGAGPGSGVSASMDANTGTGTDSGAGTSTGTGAVADPVTSVSAWPMPQGCAERLRPDSYGRVKESKPLLIEDADDLAAQVECRAGVKLDFDFSAGKIAMFPFTSQGGSFKALSTDDDGKTVTLHVESTFYCGGTPPGTVTEMFFYRVPRRTEALATKVVPAKQPPCSPDIP